MSTHENGGRNASGRDSFWRRDRKLGRLVGGTAVILALLFWGGCQLNARETRQARAAAGADLRDLRVPGSSNQGEVTWVSRNCGEGIDHHATRVEHSSARPSRLRTVLQEQLLDRGWSIGPVRDSFLGTPPPSDSSAPAVVVHKGDWDAEAYFVTTAAGSDVQMVVVNREESLDCVYD
jgi:hypothetical protein